MQTTQFLCWLDSYLKTQKKAGNTPSFCDPAICTQLSNVKDKYDRKYIVETHLCRIFKEFEKEEIMLFYELAEK